MLFPRVHLLINLIFTVSAVQVQQQVLHSSHLDLRDEHAVLKRGPLTESAVESQHPIQERKTDQTLPQEVVEHKLAADPSQIEQKSHASSDAASSPEIRMEDIDGAKTGRAVITEDHLQPIPGGNELPFYSGDDSEVEVKWPFRERTDSRSQLIKIARSDGPFNTPNPDHITYLESKLLIDWVNKHECNVRVTQLDPKKVLYRYHIYCASATPIFVTIPIAPTVLYNFLAINVNVVLTPLDRQRPNVARIQIESTIEAELKDDDGKHEKPTSSGTPISDSVQWVFTNNGSLATFQPRATIVPLNTSLEYYYDFLEFVKSARRLQDDGERERPFSDAAMKSMFTPQEWLSVMELSHLLERHRPDLLTEDCIRLAIAWQMQPRASQLARRAPPLTTTAAPTSTTTRDVCEVPTPMPTNEAAMCVKDNSKECKVKRCMLRHQLPLDIVTVFPGVMVSARQDGSGAETELGWFTHRTRLTEPHWGTTIANLTYVHAKLSPTTVHGSASLTPVLEGPPREKPTRKMDRVLGLFDSGKDGHANSPTCSDPQTCCEECRRDPGPKSRSRIRSILKITSIVIGSLMASVLLGMAVANYLRAKKARPDGKSQARAWWHNPYRRQLLTEASKLTTRADKEVTRDSAVHPSTAQPDVVVTSESTASNGRGTFRRQAEEGRAHVNFADSAEYSSDQKPLNPTPVPLSPMPSPEKVTAAPP